MIDKLRHITVNEKKYPLALTLNVMESIQETYGSFENWGNTIKPNDGEPKLKDVIWTFKEFLNEGIEIENEDSASPRPLLTHKQVGRLISNFDLKELGEIITDVTVSSVNSGEEDPNKKTTQNQQ